MRDHDVEGYWKKVFATNGRYDVRSGKFLEAHGALGYILFGWGLAGDWMVSDETSPTPSIPLGRRLQGDPIPGHVVRENAPPVPVSFFLWLEVRLALGPVNDHRSIGPLLEFRTVFEAEDSEKRVIRFDNPFTDGTDIIKNAFIGDEEFPIQYIDFMDGFSMMGTNFRPIISPDFRDDAEHSYFGWRELSPALLRDLLEGNDSENRFPFVPVRRHEGVWVEELPPSRFSSATPAGAINIDLLSGAIEAELGAECDRLMSGLDGLRAEQDLSIRDAEAEAISRWATKTATTPLVKDRTWKTD